MMKGSTASSRKPPARRQLAPNRAPQSPPGTVVASKLNPYGIAKRTAVSRARMASAKVTAAHTHAPFARSKRYTATATRA